MNKALYIILFLIIWTLLGICPLKVLVSKEYADTIENFGVCPQKRKREEIKAIASAGSRQL